MPEHRRGRARWRVLIIGPTHDHLSVQRSRIPHEAGYDVYWYDFHGGTGALAHDAPWVTEVIAAPGWSRAGRVGVALSLAWTVLRLQPCIIHVHFALCAWFQAVLVSRFHPLIVTTMGGDITFRPDFQWALREPTGYLLRQADVVTVKSDHMTSVVRALGVDAHNIRRITWGMDLQQFRPGLDTAQLRWRLGLAEDALVLFSARALEPRANVDVVVRAFAVAASDLPESAVLLVSEFHAVSEYACEIRQLTLDLGVSERVRFVGSVEYDDMPLYLCMSKAVVSATSSDGMPQTVYQAMACCTRVILSDIPETRELVDAGCSAEVVGVRDVASLAAAMRRVCQGDRNASDLADDRALVVMLANRAEQDAKLAAIYKELTSLTMRRRLLATWTALFRAASGRG